MTKTQYICIIDVPKGGNRSGNELSKIKLP